MASLCWWQLVPDIRRNDLVIRTCGGITHLSGCARPSDVFKVFTISMCQVTQVCCLQTHTLMLFHCKQVDIPSVQLQHLYWWLQILLRAQVDPDAADTNCWRNDGDDDNSDCSAVNANGHLYLQFANSNVKGKHRRQLTSTRHAVRLDQRFDSGALMASPGTGWVQPMRGDQFGRLTSITETDEPDVALKIGAPPSQTNWWLAGWWVLCGVWSQSRVALPTNISGAST